jgi:hypothetical protein
MDIYIFTVDGRLSKLKQAGIVILFRFFCNIFSTLTGAASMRIPVQLCFASRSNELE